MSDYDVLIVGGGMVGASLACAMEGQGLRIAMVESVTLRADEQPSYDERSIALAYGSRRIFEAIGIWGLLAREAEPIQEIHVSDRGHFGATRLKAADMGTEALGYVVSPRRVGSALYHVLGEAADVDVLCPASVDSIRRAGDHVCVRISVGEDQRELRAALIVAADGVHSGVRQQLDIPTVTWDYGQAAVIANVSTQRPHRGVAFERFAGSGPMALLPLAGDSEGGGRCGLVWTLRSHEVDEVVALSDPDFLRRLQSRFGFRLGAFTHVGQRRTYPLSLVRAKHHVRDRVALVGNAAHTLHPVAGQGFNLGIRDVAVLAELLADAAAQGTDPGAASLLKQYADWRRRDQRRVIAFTDGLARVFTNPLPPVAWARDLGLLGVDLLPPLKRALMRQTMGLSGRLPRLARGLPLRVRSVS